MSSLLSVLEEGQEEPVASVRERIHHNFVALDPFLATVLAEEFEFMGEGPWDLIRDSLRKHPDVCERVFRFPELNFEMIARAIVGFNFLELREEISQNVAKIILAEEEDKKPKKKKKTQPKATANAGLPPRKGTPPVSLIPKSPSCDTFPQQSLDESLGAKPIDWASSIEMNEEPNYDQDLGLDLTPPSSSSSTPVSTVSSFSSTSSSPSPQIWTSTPPAPQLNLPPASVPTETRPQTAPRTRSPTPVLLSFGRRHAPQPKQ
jgi:hypothetical protein